MKAGAWLLESGDLAARAMRFGSVGVLSGAIYALVTAAAVHFGVGPVIASVLGYCASVPMNFVGHRSFSFRSNGHWTHEAARFLFVQAVNIAVTAGAMQAAVAWLEVPYWWGMIAAVVLVPIANFAAMNLWVFRNSAEVGR